MHTRYFPIGESAKRPHVPKREQRATGVIPQHSSVLRSTLTSSARVPTGGVNLPVEIAPTAEPRTAATRKRKEPPVQPWLIIIGRVSCSTPPVVHGLDALRAPIHAWLQSEAIKKWGRYLAGCVNTFEVPVTFLLEPYAGRVVPGFQVLGLAKCPAEDSRGTLHKLVQILMDHLGPPIAELRYFGKVEAFANVGTGIPR